MQKLKIYNTLKNIKEEFVPIDANNIRIYACGPTVYDFAHIGNARMAVVFDTLVRFLRTIYPKVTYVSNITDIDDKIITRSIKEKVDFNQITEKFTKIYNEDMGRLNVIKPDHQPLATEYVKKMIVKIEELLKKKVAYHNQGHVLFNISSFPKYGILSKRSKEDQLSGARVKVAGYKKNPGDFVLWKPSSKKEPGWSSPWGIGRPGWHTECFVMSEDILKAPFDIHGGGLDLKFPHHENEIAQSCCYSDNLENADSYAKYWMHNGFVNINDQKMSKSLGNIKLVREYLKIYDGEVIRLALLSSHYRSPLNWTNNILDQSRSILDKFYLFLKNTEDFEESNRNSNFKMDKDLQEALFDDMNISKSFTYLNKKVSINLKSSKVQEILNARKNILTFGKILGILYKDPNVWFKNDLKYSNINEDIILDLIDKRNRARKNKEFNVADNIRDKLNEMGIEINDEASETNWKKR